MDTFGYTLLISIMTGLILLHVIVFIGCWCASAKYLDGTDIETQHKSTVVWALIEVIYTNEIRGITENRDYLVELVASVYVFGYTSGKCNNVSDLKSLDRYVLRHKIIEPFHNTLVPLIRHAYDQGKRGIK